MKKKALTLAIAAALSAPSSFAATDDSGMRYTSATEGFYASIRVVYESKGKKDGKGGFANDTSRIGVRGSNDMGGGLEGFYQWEAAVNISDGNPDGNNKAGGTDGSKAIDTRLGHVGVRGGFGQIQFGSFWTADLNWVGAPIDRAGTTNVSNTYYSRQREGRSQNAMEYTTPDLNGFQGAIRFSTDRQGETAAVPATAMNPYVDATQPAGKGTVGLWNLATKYETHGFKVAASYNVINDGLPGNAELAAVTTGAANTQRRGFAASGAEDLKSWSASLAYAQDNWDVGMLYGVDNTSDSDRGVRQRGGKGGCGALGATALVGTTPASAKACEDRKILAIAGGVSIDKVRITAAWERVEQEDGLEDVDGGVEVRYTFTPVTNASVRYAIRDKETAPNDENTVRVRMEHTF